MTCRDPILPEALNSYRNPGGYKFTSSTALHQILKLKVSKTSYNVYTASLIRIFRPAPSVCAPHSFPRSSPSHSLSLRPQSRRKSLSVTSESTRRAATSPECSSALTGIRSRTSTALARKYPSPSLRKHFHVGILAIPLFYSPETRKTLSSKSFCTMMLATGE